AARGGTVALQVVLADDHPMLRHGVRALLERHGVEVLAEASDGRMAAAAARELHPDVAVLDLMMPLLTGIDAAREIAETCPATQDRGRLTPRERQVVQLVAEGKSTKQVAALLGITLKTAEFHRARVMKKLDVHDVAGLVRYAIREGLIGPKPGSSPVRARSFPGVSSAAP